MADVPLRPPGVKFFGAFLCPKDWAVFNLNADWKPQIDAMKVLGANFVSYWGDIRVAKLDLPGYLVKRRALIEYIGSKGMYGLPYGMYQPNTWGTVTNAEACTIFAADAALHSQFPFIAGYNSTDEAFVDGFWSDVTVAANCAAQYAAMKAAVPPDFPISSVSIGIAGNAFDYTGINKTRLDSVAASCDFLSIHPFHNCSPSLVAPINAAYPNKQIILPSAVAQVEGTAGIAAMAASIMALVGANNIRGFGWWQALDFDSNTWAIFNNDLSERPIKTNAFRAGNTAVDLRTRIRLPGKPRAEELFKLGYTQ